MGTNRSQINLINTTLDERLPQNAKCRFIVKLVEKLNLTPLLCRYSHLGTNAISPSALLATWFLAYSEGITSSRRIEFLCTDSNQYIYVSADTRPDHATLCRFRTQDQELFAAYFVQILEMAEAEGVTCFKRIHTDGTKIEASASRKQSKTSEELEKQLAQVRQDIAEYMQRCDTTDTIEAAETTTKSEDITEIREQLEKLRLQEALLLERQEQLEERKKDLKKEHQKNHKINLTDPESQHMHKVNGKPTEPAYNAQASVEEKNQFIVACDVVTDPNDQNQATNQIENVEKNCGEDPEREYTDDAGYHSKDQLQKIEEKEGDVLIADPTPENRSIKSTPTPVDEILKEDRKVQRADFVFHEEEDYYECPAGEQLEFKRTYKRGEITGRSYEKPTPCTGCPLFERCIDKKNKSPIKRIYRDDREHLAEAMARKLQTDEARARLKKRRCTVEPVFGVMKHNMGFRRFNLRGHEKVKTEWILMCLAYNINKLFGLMGAKSKKSGENTPEKTQNFAELFVNLMAIAFLFKFIKLSNNYFHKY
jgi:transposase